MRIHFADDEFLVLVRQRVMQSSLLFALLALALFLILKRVSKRVEIETRSVIGFLSHPAPTTLNLQLEEFRSLHEDLQRITVELKNASRDKAIARTTQALAHDVRKPFSMFKNIIQIVERIDDPGEVREVLNLTLPEVNQAMASVEGMISDVMQIGSDTKMHTDNVEPEALIEAALGELFRVHPEVDVSLSYELSHRHTVIADSLRIGRVFANILGNAVQAMGEKGNLWVRTVENKGLVEFALGNAGSRIPAENLPKLFDAFFTSDKKGGTGLGLAIAKKIVEAHGGTIRCVSSVSEAHPSGFVEFLFTLPASDTPRAPRAEPLPRFSREIQSALAAVRIAAVRHGGQDPREVELEANLLAWIEREGLLESAHVTVLVVDDEAVYRNGLLSLINRSERIAARVRMVFARSDVEALAAVQAHRPALVIEDVDLGPGSKNGIEIVRMLRAQGFAGHICVHSNRFLKEDNRAALDAGADTVLPKPLGRAHFLKILLASLPKAPAISEPPAPQRLSVAMLDDSLTMRLAWKRELHADTRFRGFASTDAFFKACDEDPRYLSTLDAIVTDYNFAPADAHDGATLARALRERGYAGLILRASGESDLGAEIEALFDGDVGKVALKWPEFLAAVDAARTRRRQT